MPRKWRGRGGEEGQACNERTALRDIWKENMTVTMANPTPDDRDSKMRITTEVFCLIITRHIVNSLLEQIYFL